MIRPVLSDDAASVVAVVKDSGLFSSDEELEVIAKMLATHLDGSSENDHYWIADEDNADTGLVSVAYFGPETMTDRTWNVWLIAVRLEYQGQGRGTKLLRHIEDTLAARGERLLLVETSGTADFERTRAFYRKCGYEEEARVRDYYTTGDDKIVFRKLLTTH